MNSLLFGFLAFLYAYGGSVVFSLFESFFVEKEDGELFIRIMVFEISWSRGEFYVDLLPFVLAIVRRINNAAISLAIGKRLQ
ncbi:hypothetical protein Q7M83_03580 [Candidatus Liberibacter asiaticus]